MLPKYFYEALEEEKRREKLCKDHPLHKSKHGWTNYVAFTSRGTTCLCHIEEIDGKEYFKEKVIPETADAAEVFEVEENSHRSCDAMPNKIPLNENIIYAPTKILYIATYVKWFTVGDYAVWRLSKVTNRHRFNILAYLRLIKISKFR
jgi:hypothetical protein